jgi:hypothetical protein
LIEISEGNKSAAVKMYKMYPRSKNKLESSIAKFLPVAIQQVVNAGVVLK